MSAYEPQVAEMIRRVGGDDLLDRLSNADLPRLVRPTGKREKLTARAFEYDLVKMHRRELALLFGEEGARVSSQDRRFVTHLNIDATRVFEFDRDAWSRRARAEIRDTRERTGHYLPLLERCLDPALPAADPTVLYGAAMRLAPCDLSRLNYGILLRRQGSVANALGLYRIVLSGQPTLEYRVHTWHNVAIARLCQRRFSDAREGFRSSCLYGGGPPTPLSYRFGLAWVMGDRREIREAERLLEDAIDVANPLLEASIAGIRALDRIGAWPRPLGDARIPSVSLGRSAERIANGIA